MSLSSDIEGSLFKWTNYWGGWQPRWLVLHNGVLSYYNNIDEVGKGCRASIKISASDIVAYPTDNTRLDIVVPNEQRWYLKASNPAERQAWIIALGTSKANTSEERGHSSHVSHESYNDLRMSMSELRLFCDLLVQQTVKVKEEAQKNEPDTKTLSDSSSLLSTTCDTFLATLGRCIDISETTLELPPCPGPMLRSQSHDGQHAIPQMNKSKHKKRHSRSIGPSPPTSPIISNKFIVQSESSTSLHSVTREASRATSVPTTFGNPNTSEVKSLAETLKSTSITSTETNLAKERNNNKTFNDKQLHSIGLDDESLLTFFSAMLHSFSDIVLQEDGGISTLSFLSACDGIVPFLDTIGSTAFAPVRMDFMGNISKLRTKHSSDPGKFSTLQAILHQEIETSSTKVRNSATDALMWLKRGLRFMQKFLIIFKNGERNLTIALNQSYSTTLKPYHGWVVKGIFALAVKAAPYANDFIRALATNPDHAQDKRFLGVLMQDIDQYTTAMDVVLNIVDNYYETNRLDSKAVV